MGGGDAPPDVRRPGSQADPNLPLGGDPEVTDYVDPGAGQNIPNLPDEEVPLGGDALALDDTGVNVVDATGTPDVTRPPVTETDTGLTDDVVETEEEGMPQWMQETLDTATGTPQMPGQDPRYTAVSSIQAGQDPFSQVKNQRMSELLADRGQARGALTSENEKAMMDIIRSGGRLPQQSRRDMRRAMEIEGARSPLDALRKSQTSQAQAAMAGRGMLGSGGEMDYMQRLEGKLAPQYAAAGQRIELEERRAEDKRLSEAMSGARDLTMTQSRNLVDTIRAGTESQQMMGDMALRSLDQNMEWNKFLAEFGLKRTEVMESIQQGRLDAVLPLIQQYMGGAEISAGGFVRGEGKEDLYE